MERRKRVRLENRVSQGGRTKLDRLRMNEVVPVENRIIEESKGTWETLVLSNEEVGTGYRGKKFDETSNIDQIIDL